MVPVTCAVDGNVPEIVLVVKAFATIGIDVAGPEVMVAPVGQLDPRFGKLML
jgi:hypothetical protein